MFNQSKTKSTWQELETCLKEIAPSTLETFRDSACTCCLFGLETTVGQALPRDFKEFLYVHNGQEERENDGQYFCEEGRLLSVDEIIDTWKLLNESNQSAPVKGEWSKNLLPFARSKRKHTCIDLQNGEIVSLQDADIQRGKAMDFQSWFEDKLRVFKEGRYTLDKNRIEFVNN